MAFEACFVARRFATVWALRLRFPGEFIAGGLHNEQSTCLLAERILGWIYHKLDILLFYRPFSGSELLPYGKRAWFKYLFLPSNNDRESFSSMCDLTGCPNQAKCLLRSLTPTTRKWTLHASWFLRRGGNLNGPGGSTSLGWKRSGAALPHFSLDEVVNSAGVAANLADLRFDTGEGYNRFHWYFAGLSIRLSWLNVLKASQEKQNVYYKTLNSRIVRNVQLVIVKE